MPDFEVETGGTLDTRLARLAGIALWRVPILVTGNAVKIFRDGAEIPVTKADMHVRSGDILRLADPLPASVTTALQTAADKTTSDYAFVPGALAKKPTKFDTYMGGVVAHRPRTIWLKDPTSLRDFIAALGKGLLITAPIRHVVIASHAHLEGFLFMKLDLLDANQISYEDLEKAVQSKTLLIDPAWLQPRPRDASQVPIPAQFLVRGCRIGMPFLKLKDQHPYLTKLKEALGNKIPVVAPRHFHVGGKHGKPDGVVEFMRYGFHLTRPKPFGNKAADREALIKAFQGGGPRIDNNPVPADLWESWVPPKPHAKYEQEVDAWVINPILNSRYNVKGKFRFKNRSLFDNREQSIALDPDPGTEAGRKAAVKTDFEKAFPQYQATHAFPLYARLGYASMTEFMDGFDWKFRYDARQKTLFFNPSRAEYTAMPPITEIKTNKLILNFYPSGKKEKVLELLDIANTTLFTTV